MIFTAPDPIVPTKVAMLKVTFNVCIPPEVVYDEETGEPATIEVGGQTIPQLRYAYADINVIETDDNGRKAREVSYGNDALTQEEILGLAQILGGWAARYAADTGLSLNLTPNS